MMRVMSSSLFALAMLPLALMATGCAGGGEAGGEDAESGEAPRNVRVLELAVLDLEENLMITGPVRPLDATDISSEETGIIAAIPKDKGAGVRKGQTVVMLDRDLLKAQLDAAAADVELQAYNEERNRQLYDANSLSRQELLLSQTQLAQAEASRRIAELRYERAAIKAPFDGMVTDRYVEPGQLVSPGQMVARVIDPYTLKLEGGITEREVRWIEPGSPALVSFSANQAIAAGVVHWVGFEANPTTGKFPVEIRIDNSQLQWRGGVVGRAKVLKQVHGEVIAIPRDALVQRPGGTVVYVVEDDHAVERPVELGADQGLMVVTASGLSPGEVLVVRGQRDLSDGTLVRVQEYADNPDGSLHTDPDVIKTDGIVSSHTDLPPERGQTQELPGGSP